MAARGEYRKQFEVKGEGSFTLSKKKYIIQFSFRDRTVSFIKTGDSTSIKCYPCSTFTKLDKSDADSDGTKLTVLTVGAEKNMNKAIWFNSKVERDMFVDLVYVCMQPHLVADATKMFQSLDVNRDGRLEPEELDQAIASFRKLSTDGVASPKAEHIAPAAGVDFADFLAYYYRSQNGSMQSMLDGGSVLNSPTASDAQNAVASLLVASGMRKPASRVAMPTGRRPSVLAQNMLRFDTEQSTEESNSVNPLANAVRVAAGDIDSLTNTLADALTVHDPQSFRQQHSYPNAQPFGVSVTADPKHALTPADIASFKEPCTSTAAGIANRMPPPYHPQPWQLHAHMSALYDKQSPAALSAVVQSVSPQESDHAAASHLEYFGGEHTLAFKEATSRTDQFFQAGTSRGLLILTNYRVAYMDYRFAGQRTQYLPVHLRHTDDASCEVPLFSIVRLEKHGEHGVAIETKDYRRLVFAFDDKSSWVDGFIALLTNTVFPKEGQIKAFAFSHSLPCTTFGNGWNIYDALSEYHRIGLYPHPHFQLVDNHAYELSDTYPQSFLMPAALSSEALDAIAKHRSRARMPATVWLHPRTGATLSRCSQPNTGLGGRRCAEDEQLFTLLRTLNPSNSEVLYIMDARPLKAAVGNRVMGKGYEDMRNYEQCQVEFLNIENIHAIRDALNKLYAVVHADASLQNGSNAHVSAANMNTNTNTATSSYLTANAITSSASAVASFASNLLGFGAAQTAQTAANPQPAPKPRGFNSPSMNAATQNTTPPALTLEQHVSTAPAPFTVSHACPTYSPFNVIDACGVAGSGADSHSPSIVSPSSPFGHRPAAYVNEDDVVSNRAGITVLNERSAASEDSTQFAARVEATQWLQHIRLIIAAVVRIVQFLDVDGASVVTHCSDGWDRTSQLSSLAQLCLDPYYRTMRGFAVLLEKEWLSFGHKFSERYGHGSSNHTDDQRAPIFLQFLDCVWQIMRQYPLSFEFHDRFLLELAAHVHSGAFGTFLFDCERERAHHSLSRRTPSLWTWLMGTDSRRALFKNPMYRPNPGKLLPSATARRIVLWEAMFLQYDPLNREQESVADAAALLHARRIFRVDHMTAMDLPASVLLGCDDELIDRRLAATVLSRKQVQAEMQSHDVLSALARAPQTHAVGSMAAVAAIIDEPDRGDASDVPDVRSMISALKSVPSVIAARPPPPKDTPKEPRENRLGTDQEQTETGMVVDIMEDRDIVHRARSSRVGAAFQIPADLRADAPDTE